MLPFGALVFSTQGKGPLPRECADGDPDGDYYFCCWDQSIVEHVAPRIAAVASSTKSGKKAVGELGATWLASAQEHMLDVTALREHKDVCKLYKRWEQSVASSSLGMDDADARSYAEAYVQALEHGKHGEGVRLPEHLQL